MGKNSDLHPHSYHQDYPWTQKQDTGFTSGLDHKEGLYPLYSRYYLDAKRRDYDGDTKEKFVHYMRSKYKGYEPRNNLRHFGDNDQNLS